MENSRSVNFEKKKNDHWWPKSLIGLWRDDEGWVHQMEPNGEVKDFKHGKKIASINGGHLIHQCGPWARSAETLFEEVDRSCKSVIEKIEQAVKIDALPVSEVHLLPKIVASLIVRSPSFRNKASLVREQFKVESNGYDVGNLEAGSIAQSFHMITKGVERSDVRMLVRSRVGEFIFGDGIFNNFTMFHRY